VSEHSLTRAVVVREINIQMRTLIKTWLRPRGHAAFIQSLPLGARMLDAGCGNEGPRLSKEQRPDLYYIGIDVCDYNQTRPREFAEEYIITPSAAFASVIAKYRGTIDGVVSNHNHEHCEQPDEVLAALISAVRPGGRLFMAFPSRNSLTLPSRKGTLNFRDDETHQMLPDYDKILAAMKSAGLEVEFARAIYRPLFQSLLGLALEPISRARRQVMPGTWAWKGFESVIWAHRPAAD
jgi:SAM-dependent methyltransferase